MNYIFRFAAIVLLTAHVTEALGAMRSFSSAAPRLKQLCTPMQPTLQRSLSTTPACKHQFETIENTNGAWVRVNDYAPADGWATRIVSPWYKTDESTTLIEKLWRTSPQEYAKIFSQRLHSLDIKIPRDVWQYLALEHLKKSVTAENIPTLLETLVHEKEIGSIDPRAVYFLFHAGLQNKDATRNMIASIDNINNLNNLLTNSEGNNLVAAVMDENLAKQITSLIVANPSHINHWLRYGGKPFFDVASKILEFNPEAKNNLLLPIGETLNLPLPATLALQIVRTHPESGRLLYPYVKQNAMALLKMADEWDYMRVLNDHVAELGEENMPLELMRAVTKMMPEAQTDFYCIFNRNRKAIRGSAQVKEFINNLESSYAPITTRFKNITGSRYVGNEASKNRNFAKGAAAATAGAVSYGLYKAYGEDKQTDGRVQE